MARGERVMWKQVVSRWTNGASPSDRTSRLGSRMLVAGCVGLLLGGGIWMAVTVHREQQESGRQEEWMRRVEELGAEAHIAGYGGFADSARIPFVGALASKTQVEVMLPNSDVATAVLPLLRELPELGRIWIHKHGVDSERVQQIKSARPEVSTIFYTTK